MRRALLLLAVHFVAACSSGDAPRGTAAITIVDGGPLVGVDVVFHHPDGRVLNHALTGADGSASATVEAGTLITVARFLNGLDEWRLTTVAGVEPGDDLLLDWTGTGGQLVGWAQVTYPGTFAGADQYSVDLGCTGSAWSYLPDPVTVPLLSTCGTTVDAIAIANSAGSGMVAWATAAGVPITGTEPDRTAEVTLGAWRTDLGTMAVTLQNPPASATFTHAWLQPRRNGQLWHASTADATSLSPPAAATLSLPFARDFWASGRLTLAVLHDQDGLEQGAFVENEVPLASWDVDLATAIPPRLSGLEVAETQGGHRASWIRAASDGGLDGTFLEATWYDAGGLHRWIVVLPPCCTSFDFPDLPAELAAFLPEAGTALHGAVVRSVDLSTAASYREFRASHLAFLDRLPETGTWTLRQSASVLP